MIGILGHSYLIAARRSHALLADIKHMSELRRQRLALRNLDDAALKDIGLTRADAEQEASKPMWDAPRHWHW